MLEVHATSPSPEASLQTSPTLAELSRNASVISSSSSSSSTSDLTIQTPPTRPRPLRTFSSPRTHVRSRSPQSPTTPRGSRPPAYLARELGLAADDNEPRRPPPASRTQSKSRNNSLNARTSPDDFEFGRVLGEGSYSEVRLAKHRSTQQEYAVKIIEKVHLVRHEKMPVAMAEKNTLVRLGTGHPGIVRLHWTFQDDWRLYFVLDLARNGELQTRISRLGSLALECSRTYAAQIVDALEYMHSKGVIHRDLKPENLLLDDDFRIKITDFGTGKVLGTGDERTKTFVGTAQYVSPELLEDGETSKSSDLWALGCILYQMIAGKFAFQGLTDYLTWQKVKRLEYTFPEGFDEQAKDIVQRLIVRDPAERLGAGPPGSPNDMQALRAHPFFASIKWGALWTDPVPPLEPGLVRKQPSSSENEKRGWKDVGAAWDEIVGSDGDDGEDDIEWASDGEDMNPFARNGALRTGRYHYEEEVGPLGERRPMAFPSIAEPGEEASEPPDQGVQSADKAALQTNGVRFADVPTSGDAICESPEPPAQAAAPPGSSAPEDVPTAVKTQPIDVPPANGIVDSCSTGSATSSSDGSPVSRLEAAMEAAALERGRNRAQTPIRAAVPSDAQWTSMMIAGEGILFSTTVEASAIRRRASRLLAMAGGPRKLKARELVLTTHRLVCLKQRRAGHGIETRLELSLRPGAKEKDARHMVTGVEPKGEREFVVLTPTKSHSFVAANPEIAQAWIRKIQDAVETYGPSPMTPRQNSNSRTRS